MDNDTGERRLWNVEEHCRKSIDGEQDNDGRNDTGKGCTYSGLGLDRSPRERSSSRVTAKEWSKEVRHANSHQLLRRIDCIVVDPAKGLGNGDVLDKQNDD